MAKIKFLILGLVFLSLVSFSNEEFGYSSGQIGNISAPADRFFAGDINGDGKDDLLLLTGNDGWYVSYNGTSKWTKSSNSLTVAENALIGDFNGDGKADIIRPKGGKDEIMIDYGCDGDEWVKRSVESPSASDCLVGDVNADGSDDLIWLTGKDGWYVSYNGTSEWTKVCGSLTVAENALVGDFNGDGKADMARPKSDSVVMIDYSCDGDEWVTYNL